MPANAASPFPLIGLQRTIPDSRLIRDWIDQHDVKTAVVVGGGFIGIEMAENLIERGLKVTLVRACMHVAACNVHAPAHAQPTPHRRLI